MCEYPLSKNGLNPVEPGNYRAPDPPSPGGADARTPLLSRRGAGGVPVPAGCSQNRPVSRCPGLTGEAWHTSGVPVHARSGAASLVEASSKVAMSSG
jgi:hypothetical protein